MRERNRLLRDQVMDAHWYAALEGQMAEAGARISAHRAAAVARLMAAQEGAETAFPAADLAIEGGSGALVADLAEALVAGLVASRRADLAAGRTLVGPHRDDLRAVYAAKGVPADQCSTGEQKALLLSLVLANARALAQDFGAPPILLLDEVAAHLDASRRAALYDEICALGAQAWMTGTGAELFEALGDRAEYIEVTEAEGVSVVRRECR
jgi:DNA replication and repair protein RecF